MRLAAALPTLRIHDLRHVFAGMGAALGLGLPVVGKLLGHSQPQTTARYANLAPDPVHAAVDAIGEALTQQMKKGQAKIIPVIQDGEVGNSEEGEATLGPKELWLLNGWRSTAELRNLQGPRDHTIPHVHLLTRVACACRNKPKALPSTAPKMLLLDHDT